MISLGIDRMSYPIKALLKIYPSLRSSDRRGAPVAVTANTLGVVDWQPNELGGDVGEPEAC